MTLKVKRTHIRDGCTVAFGATVMGGAVIERDTTLLPLSLVLKEMNMITATYEGSPAEPVSGTTLKSGVQRSWALEKAAIDERDYLRSL
jgi:carbonic anhydrase/acetyltransferase-like protein (isoleucine patch superfamily)